MTERQDNVFWWEEAPPADTPKKDVENDCDAAVVGAGYTGLSAAITLARAGLSVQVFDAHEPGYGASTRNGGFASGNLKYSLKQAMEKFGDDTGISMYREAAEARDALKTFIEAENIACDYSPCGRLTCAVAPRHMDALAEHVALMNDRLGIEARMLSRDALRDETGADVYHGAMLRPDIATLHPAKLHAGMLRAATGAKASIHAHTPVTGITRTGDAFTVATARGAVTAKHVLVATNGYGDAFDRWLRRRIVPVASRIVVTEPLPEDLTGRLMTQGRAMTETRNLTRYYRPTPDGRRIMLGAREPAFGGTLEHRIEHVRTNLTGIFPELEDVAISHSWAGYVAFHRAELPRLFTHDGVQYALGYCGSGVVWAHWLGVKAAKRICGEAEEAATCFACDPPPAVPLYSGKPWFLPVAIGWKALKDRLAA